MSERPEATLRHADPQRDAAACAAIYAPYVDASAISFETVAPCEQQMRDRIETIGRTYPWLVLEQDGRVMAFAYASLHRTRAAYRWAVEVGIYVDPACHGCGFGRRLYEALFELLRRQHVRIAVAGITLPNDASIALHRGLGFQRYGVQRAIGYKNGAWHDVSWWQLRLAAQEGDEAPPPEPIGPQRLED